MGVLGLPHALFDALSFLSDQGRFGAGSGAALSVGGVAPGLPKAQRCALFSSPNPFKSTSLEAPAPVATMAAAAEEILGGMSLPR